jgi:dephospho-CoA kinase
MDRLVIGLVGPIAGGKGVLANYLREQGFEYYSLSDILRLELKQKDLPINRKNLQDIGNELRENYGAGILAEKTTALISRESKKIIIDSVRNPGEINFLKMHLHSIIWGVDAPDDLRLKWYMERAKLRGEDEVSEEMFRIANLRDKGEGESDTGQQVGKCLEMADKIFINDGSAKELLEACENELNKIIFMEGNHIGKERNF